MEVERRQDSAPESGDARLGRKSPGQQRIRWRAAHAFPAEFSAVEPERDAETDTNLGAEIKRVPVEQFQRGRRRKDAA